MRFKHHLWKKKVIIVLTIKREKLQPWSLGVALIPTNPLPQNSNLASSRNSFLGKFEQHMGAFLFLPQP